MESVVVIDVETNGLQPSDGARIFKIGMEDEDGNVIKCRRSEMADWLKVKKVVEDPSIDKVCHNTKFELRMFYHEGWKPKGTWHDTMVMAHILNEYEPSLSLEYLSKKYFPESHKNPAPVRNWIKDEKKLRRKSDGPYIEPTYEDVPAKIMDPYLETDLDSTMRLHWAMYPRMKGSFNDIYEWERRLIPAVAYMENTGIKVDKYYLLASIRRTLPKINELEDKLHKIAGMRFNPRSPIQVAAVLENAGIYISERTKGGGVATGKDVIKKVDHPLTKALLEYRTLTKLYGTYLVPLYQLAIGDVLHGSFWQLGEEEGIKTARFSSSKPNLQNIPIRESSIVRRAFIPRDGYVFVFFDYAQIEARIFAHYARDRTMIDAFLKGIDVYETDMYRIWGKSQVLKWKKCDPKKFKYQRFVAKTVRLALQYGMGAAKLADKINYSLAEARVFKKKYLRLFPSVKALIESSQVELIRNGYVEDVFDRRYRVPRHVSYKAVNAKIQGAAASVLKRGMVRCWEGPCQTEDLHMLMTIHDEIVFEMRKEDMLRLIPEIVRRMEDHGSFVLPMLVDVEWSDKSWAQKVPWKKVV